MGMQKTIHYEVTDYVVVLALDKMVRDYRSGFETEELLPLARTVASELGLTAEHMAEPSQGYYSETEELVEYFKLCRVLQGVDRGRVSEIQSQAAFARLHEVFASPMNGETSGDGLLPGGVNPLTQALMGYLPEEWSLPLLVAAARENARANADDYSLVGLAAWTGDAVLLTATSETQVLMTAVAAGCAAGGPGLTRYDYHWRVSPELERRATCLVTEFNRLFGEMIPLPCAENASDYYHEPDMYSLRHRVVRIGCNDEQTRHYHWQLMESPLGFEVAEIWADEILATPVMG